jgi:hypothetical protein
VYGYLLGICCFNFQGKDPMMGALSSWLHPSERTAYAEFLSAEDVEMDEEIRKAQPAPGDHLALRAL